MWYSFDLQGVGNGLGESSGAGHADADVCLPGWVAKEPRWLTMNFFSSRAEVIETEIVLVIVFAVVVLLVDLFHAGVPY